MKNVLVNFIKDVPEIEDADDIKFQRVHRMEKAKKDGHGSRIIIARFLRFPDRDRVSNAVENLKALIIRCMRTSPKSCMN